MIRRRWLTVLAVVTCSLNAGAQATPLVPPNAAVYRDIERLAAVGLIDTLIVGVRPFTEREVVRLLHEARANLDRVPRARAWAEQTIDADIARYDRQKNRPLDEAWLELAQMSSPARPAPSDQNGLIDADINPLAANRGGRPLADGTTVRIETSHSATLGRYLAVTASPRATTSSRSPTAGNVTMQTANATALLGGVAIEAGRDYMVFGQAPEGGIMLSDNAPSLDMVRIWNDRAWRVPLVSRLVGPIRGSAFVADLGNTRQNFSHTKLIGYHVAALPHPQLEIGLEVL
ncbi:MAG TPA: capsule assembly Wzi family protein, partial [Gemmatimonadaceae bacterium]